MTTTQTALARAREAFIVDGIEMDGVRPETYAAWRRCKAAGVSPVGTPVVQMGHEYDRESALLRAVRPIGERLVREFKEPDLALMVVDRNAQIVDRWFTSPSMGRRLDRMGVLPGAVFDEAYVGSTGLGTALEEGLPTIVDGAEHYNDSFDSVVAVGAPIVHPGTGVVEGVIDIVARTGVPVGLMLPVITNAAREIGECLVTGYAQEDRGLLDAFLQIERRGLRRPMMAINSRLMFANRQASELVGTQVHSELWEQIQGARSAGLDSVLLGDPGDDVARRAHIRAVRTGGEEVGAVLQIMTSRARARVLTPGFAPRDSLGARIKERLPGRSLRWTAVVDSMAAALEGGTPVVLTGPTGVGKSVLAATAASLWAGGEQYVSVIDEPGAAVLDSVRALGRGSRAVVIDNVDTAVESAAAYAELIDTDPGDPTRLILVQSSVDEPGAASWRGFRDIGFRDIELPSLAYRVADIDDLIHAWTTRGEGDRPAVEAEAVRELIRRRWPGNVRQLFWALDMADAKRQGLTIRVQDLPEATAAVRRRLTYLENVERDAIAKLLAASEGRKTDVARELGVSRSTLYRKLAALGLDD